MKKNQITEISDVLVPAPCTQPDDRCSSIPARSYDELRLRSGDLQYDLSGILTGREAEELAGHQKELCMVGDSVTWAEDGDWFRRHLLALMPELAFSGTHTAMLGYSHAGEGGDATWDVLNRIGDTRRIPDCPYYHLLIGINDCSGAKSPDQVEQVSAETEIRIVQLVRELLKRPGTEKVFLGSLLPGPFEPDSWKPTPRDMAGARTNALLRRNLNTYFPGGNVVWIEYELPLREIGKRWKNSDTLRGPHPTAQGYRYLAELAAPVLRREMETTAVPETGKRIAVEVVNLWREAEEESYPLLPGWYILSFALDGADVADFTLFSTGDAEKGRFEHRWKLSCLPGERLEVKFMTGYERYGYTRAPFRLKMAEGKARDIQIEKMRPSGKASRFGRGSFADADSPVSAGEKLFRCQ